MKAQLTNRLIDRVLNLVPPGESSTGYIRDLKGSGEWELAEIVELADILNYENKSQVLKALDNCTLHAVNSDDKVLANRFKDV